MKTGRTTSSDNIDKFHDSMVQKYNRAQQTDVPKLRQEQATLRSLVKTLSPSDKKLYAANQRLATIRTELARIESEFREYMQSSAHALFRYYEEKQQTSSGNNVANSSSVMAFFTRGLDLTSDPTSGPTGGQELQTTRSQFDENKRFYQKYWTRVGGHLAHAQDYTFNPNLCTSCETGEMIPQDEEGTMQCNNDACGRYIIHIVDSQKSTHTEVQNEVYYTAYVRLNHFKEILSQFQAKQSTVIPPEIIARIRARMAKERMTVADINYTQMRHILTVLELSKYFEHIQHINAIFGVVPPKMDDELYNTLCMLFVEIQEPWARCCPPNRVNFFNYTYVLHQLLVLLDQRKYLPYLSMSADRELKDQAKRGEQEIVWRSVCAELDWLYCPG